MKQFVVFNGSTYDPTLAWDAFVAAVDSITEARELRDHGFQEHHRSPRWCQIVDLETMQVAEFWIKYWTEEPKSSDDWVLK